MEYLEVKSIEFQSLTEANKSKNYSESGFYLRTVTDEDHNSQELVFVDKSFPQTHFVCPKSVYDGLQFLAIKPLEEPKVLTSNEVLPPNGMVSENFVLDFTKILIGKK